MRPIAFVVLLGSLAVAAACSKSSNGTPTAPSTTLVSISVSSAGPTLVIGATETFTATGSTMSGAQQALTGATWGGDNPGVATVSATGVVTAVGYGRVTIFVDAQGVRGSKLIQVVPEFAGQFTGSYRVETCVESGDWIDSGLCVDAFTPGEDLPLVFVMTRSGTTVNGGVALGGILSDVFSASIRPDGGLTVQATALLAGATLAQTWELRADTTGMITGTATVVISAPGISGQSVFTATITTLTGSPGTAAMWPAPPRVGGDPIAAIKAAIRR